VVCHRQIYTGGGESGPTSFAGKLQSELEPLFIQHSVDVVLAAHAHTYQRMCAQKNGKCVPTGVRCAFFDGILHSRIAEDATGSHAFAPLEASEHADDQWHSSRVFTPLPVDAVISVQTLKVAAPIYIVDGTAGAYTGAGDEGYSCNQPKGPFPGTTLLAEDCTWGWSTLEANQTDLEWRHYRWENGTLGDVVALRKETTTL
jgi:hypothetical protein